MSAPSKPSEHPKGSWEDTIIEDSSDLEDSWADDVMFDGSHSSGKEMKNFVKSFQEKFRENDFTKLVSIENQIFKFLNF